MATAGLVVSSGRQNETYTISQTDGKITGGRIGQIKMSKEFAKKFSEAFSSTQKKLPTKPGVKTTKSGK